MAERQAIERHCQKMSQERGSQVNMKEAEAEWLAHHAARWRHDRQCHCLSLQREEINRHKWIRSEQAQRDLGHEAVYEWIEKYAADWRRWYEQEFETA